MEFLGGESLLAAVVDVCLAYPLAKRLVRDAESRATCLTVLPGSPAKRTASARNSGGYPTRGTWTPSRDRGSNFRVMFPHFRVSTEPGQVQTAPEGSWPGNPMIRSSCRGTSAAGLARQVHAASAEPQVAAAAFARLDFSAGAVAFAERGCLDGLAGNRPAPPATRAPHAP
jgi:hypothetical protein